MAADLAAQLAGRARLDAGARSVGWKLEYGIAEIEAVAAIAPPGERGRTAASRAGGRVSRRAARASAALATRVGRIDVDYRRRFGPRRGGRRVGRSPQRGLVEFVPPPRDGA
jgi:hypothetical protein